MPFPFAFAALVPPLVAWGTRAAATYGLARLFSDEPLDELKNMLVGWVIEQAATRAGLALNPDDPFSDSSLAGAVSARIGIPVRSLRDPAMVREDLENFTVALVSEKSGYQISSVTNPAALRADLQRIGAAIAAEKIGLPVGMLDGDPADFSGDEIKERVLAWAKAEIMLRATEKAGPLLAELVESANIEDVAAELNGRLAALGSTETIDALKLANKLAVGMATDAVAGFGKVAVKMTKRSRRQELNRAAQDKFRRVHGNRQKYVPIGMTAIIE
jgi:hypothetical protein